LGSVLVGWDDRGGVEMGCGENLGRLWAWELR
jgi:hypothetical protein